MHVPRVSIGLPVYNGEKYIRLAVESLLQQDYTEFELSISDNASTDATQEICLELAAKDARIRYIRNATNIGLSGNFNRVFELCNGEFFVWAHHDDIYLPGFLRRCVDMLEQAPATVVLVAPRMEVIDEKESSAQLCVERLHTTHAFPHQRIADVLRDVRWCVAQYGLFRSAALRKTRLMDGFYGSDRVLLLELAILGEIWEIPETLFLKRKHPERFKTRVEFAAWFDPTQKGRNARRKLILEYARSIARLTSTPDERLLCLSTAFFVWYRRKFTARNLVKFLQGARPDQAPIKADRARKTRRKPVERDSRQRNVCFFGPFGSPNFGNEITLQTILHHIRRRLPEAKITCVCHEAEVLRATQNIDTVPISPAFLKHWSPRTRLERLLKRVFVEVPSEPWRWLDAFKKLKGADTLIVPGTGLLTDAFGLSAWGGLYDLFKWSLLAKLRGCEVHFVSVGAGPISSGLGRYFVKSALSRANFRSYRDDASKACLKGIGFATNGDRVYPDLVFSLPENTIARDVGKRTGRPVVGLGVMSIHGMYGSEKPSNRNYQEYLDNLVAFAGWLLEHDYDIRLLVGEAGDRTVSKQLKSLLKASFRRYDEKRILDQPTLCVEQLLPQIAETDIVVATRFHNVLLPLVFNKPVIAISHHQKCASLMRDMGLEEYCHDINDMNAGRLIEQFQSLEMNTEKLKSIIRQRVEHSRKALDEQYELIFKRISVKLQPNALIDTIRLRNLPQEI